MTTRRVLVVGGSGFIGQHICHALRGAGWCVLVANRTGAEVPGCAMAVVGSGDDRRTELARIVRWWQPTVIVNSAGAAWAPTREALGDSNVRCAEDIALTIAHCTPRTGPRPRLVHLGSSFEYAPAARGTSLSERAPVAPRTDYGSSKLEGTLRVLDTARTRDVDAVVLRIFNAIGPDVPSASLLGRTVRSLLQAHGTGQEALVELPPVVQERDFVDVRDVARAVVAAAKESGATEPTVVNVGSGTAIGTDALVRGLVEGSGVATRTWTPSRPSPAFDNGLGWQRADISTATTLWGWRPRVSLDRTLRDLWTTSISGRKQTAHSGESVSRTAATTHQQHAQEVTYEQPPQGYDPRPGP